MKVRSDYSSTFSWCFWLRYYEKDLLLQIARFQADVSLLLSVAFSQLNFWPVTISIRGLFCENKREKRDTEITEGFKVP